MVDSPFCKCSGIQSITQIIELVKQRAVPDDALIDYVIYEICDGKINKTLLYGVTTINEYKIKI